MTAGTQGEEAGMTAAAGTRGEEARRTAAAGTRGGEDDGGGNPGADFLYPLTTYATPLANQLAKNSPAVFVCSHNHHLGDGSAMNSTYIDLCPDTFSSQA